MKKIVPILFIATISIFGTCSKTDDAAANTINCNGLVTDTAATGNTAQIYMPNAFSPNADGVNDICRPVTQNIASIEFTIYDEGGAVVFTTTQLGQGWSPPFVNNTAVKYYFHIQTTTTANKKIGLCGEVYKLTCFPSSIPRSSFYFEDQLTGFGFTGITTEHLSVCP